jgi:uncharacterized protein (TIGR02145 family)
MKRSNLLLVLYLTILQIGITTYAQKVSNITFRQEQSTIIVSYDLETKTPCKVSLYVSNNGGTSWQGPLTKITGDVGDKITSGSHNITWNVLEEFEELRGDKIMFQVRTVGDNIETVVIGTQEWTTKNLNVSTYRNGDVIPEVKDLSQLRDLKTGAWCYYENNPKNGEIYAKLYNWYAVKDTRGLAPEGFHIPSDFEWVTLTNYLGGEDIAGGILKAVGYKNWKIPNTSATNSISFKGLPGGYCGVNGIFYNMGIEGNWWSSSEVDTSEAWGRLLSYNSSNARSSNASKTYGFSVRCLRD